MRNTDEMWASLKNLIQEHGKQEYAYFLWFSMHIYLKIWILKWKILICYLNIDVVVCGMIRDAESIKRIKSGGNKRLRAYLKRRKLGHPRFSAKFYNSEVIKTYVERVSLKSLNCIQMKQDFQC